MILKSINVAVFNRMEVVHPPSGMRIGGIKILVDPAIPHDEVHFVTPTVKHVVKLAANDADDAKLESSTSEGGIRA